MKVKINNEWVENVVRIEQIDYDCWEIEILNEQWSKQGKIQDIRLVEDKPEEIEEKYKQFKYDIMAILDDKFLEIEQEITKAINELRRG